MFWYQNLTWLYQNFSQLTKPPIKASCTPSKTSSTHPILKNRTVKPQPNNPITNSNSNIDKSLRFFRSACFMIDQIKKFHSHWNILTVENLNFPIILRISKSADFCQYSSINHFSNDTLNHRIGDHSTIFCDSVHMWLSIDFVFFFDVSF
jgi:hypothetical protein